MEARGKLLLKVTGILLIIGGVLNFIVGLIGFFGGGAGAILGSRVQGVTADMAATSGIILIAYSLGCMVYGVISFISGFFGVKLAENTYKAKTCINMGILLLIVSLIIAGISYLSSGFSIGMLTGEIVPILYLIGGFMNKETAVQ